jgi:hypothetical protein
VRRAGGKEVLPKKEEPATVLEVLEVVDQSASLDLDARWDMRRAKSGVPRMMIAVVRRGSWRRVCQAAWAPRETPRAMWVFGSGREGGR